MRERQIERAFTVIYLPSKTRSLSAVMASLRRSPKMTSYRPSSRFKWKSTLSLSLDPTVLP